MSVREIDRNRLDGPAAKERLLRNITLGQKIVNYLGHGSTDLWGSRLLTNEDAPGLRNGDHLPLFVTMTCLNGYFHDPALDGLAEALLKAPRGGAIAVGGSSGIVEPTEQVVMNQALYRLLFSVTSPGASTQTLGELTAKAKATVTDDDIRRTWILFGDPSMKLK